MKIFLPVILFLFFLVPFSAYAQSATLRGVSIAPAVLEVVLKNPGEEAQIKLTLTNTTDKPIILELFPIDFKQKDAAGGIGFLGRDAGNYSYSLASFLSFAESEVRLEPEEKREIIVTATNRDDLSPGGHYAAIVARLVQPEQKQTTVSPAVSSLILLRKTGGERFHLSLKSLDFPKQLFVFGYPKSAILTFMNEGNVHMVPYGEILIKDSFGRILSKGVLNTPSLKILPESRRLVPAGLKSMNWSLPISINTIEVKGTDSLEKANFVTKESFIYVNPIFLIALFVIGGWFLFHKSKE